MPNIIKAVVNQSPDMKIIKADSTSFDGKTPSTKVTVSAVFQQADIPNANGHYFSHQILSDALNKASERISRRGLKGELDHPNDIEDVIRLSTIELKNVSHLITSLSMDGDFVVGNFETLETPAGMILSSLIKDKIEVGVSIRAITDDDINYSDDNVNHISAFDLITYDCVDNPAYEGANVQSILSQTIFPISKIITSNKFSEIKNEKNEILYTEDDVKEILNLFTKNFIMNIKKNKK
jgi:hypothetical protein